MPDLLIELFSEEIPARMQGKASDDLKRLVTNGLVEAGLSYSGAVAHATPRRLVLAVAGLPEGSAAKSEERKGPKVGAPEKAIEGFLRSTGLTMDDLQARDTGKGEVYFARIETPGRPTADIVGEVLADAIKNFPWPKSMRWGSGNLRWVRPLHHVLCILTDEAGTAVVPVDVDVPVVDHTEGHRFLAPGAIKVTSFEDFEAKLKRAHVILNAEDRAEAIWADATNMAFAQGLEVVEDKGLLAEVAGLVEWPVVLMGDIAEDFLGLPAEVLQTSMREHQKFFSVKNPKTGRIEKFVTVANRETADNGEMIMIGNRKVLSARLSDAKFFWENDLRVAQGDKMVPWTDQLSNVTFHAKLGSQAERIDRIAALAKELAPSVGADPAAAEQAAKVAKADLSSEMVYEFPELQGIMGRYYAAEAGFSDEIAAAAEEHYAPLGPSDDVPTAPVSVAVALADKLDTLTGFWQIDEKPTGSKDPYALRRAALGVVRVILEHDTRITLLDVASKHIEAIMEQHKRRKLAENRSSGSDGFAAIGFVKTEIDGRKVNRPAPELLTFLHDRLKVYMRDRGVRHDVLDASLAMPGSDDLSLLVKRAEALQTVLATEDGENLIQGFKRANNILTQAEEADGVEYSYGAELKFAEADEEKALFAALDAAEAAIKPAMDAEDFETAMGAMAALRGPVDAFFEAVQVNAENEILRRNRLNLLSRIRSTCSSVADLTKIES